MDLPADRAGAAIQGAGNGSDALVLLPFKRYRVALCVFDLLVCLLAYEASTLEGVALLI